MRETSPRKRLERAWGAGLTAKTRYEFSTHHGIEHSIPFRAR
jgi:hypothetical protein